MPTTQASPGKKWITVPKVVNGITTEEQVEVDDVAGPTWGPKDKHTILNSRIPRADGPAKCTGTAVYTHDIRLPDMLFGRMITSPHAHAKVVSIDVGPALAIDGVKAAIPVSPLPNGEVRFEGQPVAAVAATTPELADDAARAVVVKYEVLPHLVKAEDALKPDAPKLFPDPRVNKRGNEQDVLAAITKADFNFDSQYQSAIMHHCCLETHSVVVDYTGGDSATVYCSTQNAGGIPGESARELGLAPNKVLGIVHHMGGGFGSKFSPGFMGMYACRIAKQLKQPVKMVLTRREEFLAAGNGPGSIQTFKLGVNKDGVIPAIHTVQRTLPGIGNSNVGAQPYQYFVAQVYNESSPLNTNEDSSVAMRAPGHPQACYAMESIMDEAAEKIGMDPVEFRKKNLPKNDAGVAWTRQLDTGAKAIGWENRNSKPAATQGIVKKGYGCAIGAWGGAGRGGCVVTVSVSPDGTIMATNASQDLGTGTRTYLRAIVAEELGLEYADVAEEIGETRFSAGTSSGGSTTAASLAPAAKMAAYNARIEIAKRVAPLIGAEPDAVLFQNRQIMGNGKALDWKQACAALPAAGLTVTGNWSNNLAGGNAHGASFAEVEVDTETGHVRVTRMCHVQDCGLPLNRLAIESQINGGIIQSLGMALYEGRVMDADLGVMVNSGFGDYKLAGCREIPETIPIIDDGDTRNVVMGMAEPANIPGAAAIANAVYNACGVRVRSLPITPDKILNGLYQTA